jgi:hypothetical protein
MASWLGASSTVGFTLALLLAGGFDLRRRRVPLLLLIALVAFAVLACATDISAAADRVTFGTVAIAAAAVTLGAVGVVGAADVIAVLAWLGFLLSGGPGSSTAAVSLAGAVVVALLWFGGRAGRSLRISGVPRNPWDVLALFAGRWEAEPRLRARDHARRARLGRDAIARSLDARRTPDGTHLVPDPCPLVACLAAGWSLALAVG